MKASLFLGCTVPVRNLNYETAARKVAAELGLELVDEPDYQCCGFPLKSISTEDALLVTARNLALAGRSGLPVVTLCSACNVTLAEAAHRLDGDPELLERVNARLAEIGLEYRPGQAVYHFVRYLITEVGLDKLAAKVKRPLTGYRFSPHYGCHYLKPGVIHGPFDDPIRPRTLARVLEVLGAEAVDDGATTDCCGGGLLGTNEELANQLTLGRLKAAAGAEADGLVLVCPFCNVMLEGQQKKVMKAEGIKAKVPIFFLPQLIGLALGFSPSEMGFKLNRIKNKELVKAFEEQD